MRSFVVGQVAEVRKEVRLRYENWYEEFVVERKIWPGIGDEENDTGGYKSEEENLV